MSALCYTISWILFKINEWMTLFFLISPSNDVAYASSFYLSIQPSILPTLLLFESISVFSPTFFYFFFVSISPSSIDDFISSRWRSWTWHWALKRCWWPPMRNGWINEWNYLKWLCQTATQNIMIALRFVILLNLILFFFRLQVERKLQLSTMINVILENF